MGHYSTGNVDGEGRVMAGNTERKIYAGLRLLMLSALSVILICTGSAFSEVATERWIKPFRWIQICPRIGIAPAECMTIYGGAGGTPLKVRQTIRNATGDQTYIRVETAGDKAGFIAENDTGMTSIDPEIERDEVLGCVIRGKPWIGMDQARVLSTCWGRPRVIRTVTTTKAVSEVYFYSNGRALHLTNGVVDIVFEQY
jgi:hypothetical protein